MIRRISFWLFVVSVAFTAWFFYNHPDWVVAGPPSAGNVQQSITCSPGSFDAGGMCRSEPTGCPYGESIPVDSPKCVAPSPEAWEPFGFQEEFGK